MTHLLLGALAGIRVIDLTRVLGGPYCTQMLADHGADVIKIEPPSGDETRTWGPPFKDGMSAYYAGANRNKRALGIDLSQPAGRDVVLRLLAGADVLIHNFKTGTLERWGLGYDDLRVRFPTLVFCHLTGFGDDGPLGGLPGYDAVIQAMSGMMSVNGTPDTAPLKVGTPIVDIGAGLIAAIAILAALVERGRSGLGQRIEVPLFDAALSMLHPQGANVLMSGHTPVATGNAHPNIAPYDMFPTATQPLYLAVGNNTQFATLCDVLGIPDAVADPRFISNADRLAHRAALTELLGAQLATRDAEALEWVLLRAGVPAGVVRTIPEAQAHPHTAHRGMVVEKEGYRGAGIPARLSRTPGAVRLAPPRFGADAREVLAQAGFSDAESDALFAAGVVLGPGSIET
jgi:crotonobetainyl-CoA:carnitine CoA-transferase CaiB-like acyl-CoA transferase